MTILQKQQEQQSELHSKLWAMANDLRGNMEAYEFKNYILGLIFYRYLSEKTETFMKKLLKEDNLLYVQAWENEEYKSILIEESLETLGYVIEPQYLFSLIINAIETDAFDIELLQKAINSITESTIGNASQDAFESLFEDMDLSSTKLGREISSRSKLIAKILTTVDSIDFKHDDLAIDVLGDAYEYLIGQFAATAGKKAGEFFTEPQCAKLLAKLATIGLTDILSASDCACGSGSLLLRVAKEANVRTFYGQELTSTTYNLARMNMLLHDVPYQNFSIKNCDTLENPYFKDNLFEVQVANPPYSVNWSADAKYLEDERFSAYGKLAPKSKADFAFVQHMIHHMTDNGTVAVLLPHGVLFRGGSEGAIRKHIITEQNYLDAVIGLPAKMFWGTDIAVSILLFKKNRENKDNIMFIDASKSYEEGKNQNRMRDTDIENILHAYMDRKDIDKFAHVASMEEIKENDYSLNIPRYVDTFEKEAKIDIKQVKLNISEIKDEIKTIEQELEDYFKELGI